MRWPRTAAGKVSLSAWWVAMLGAAQRGCGTATLDDALVEIAAVVDSLGPLQAWDTCGASEQCRTDLSFSLMRMAAEDEYRAVDWCASHTTWCTWCDTTSTTCANASGAGAFDCSGEPHNLALRPAAILCRAGGCTAAECCTNVPHQEAREQFRQAFAAAPPISDWQTVASSIVFAADISELAEDSAARIEFEFGFKVAMARALGDGLTVRAEHIFVDGIRPGSIVVDWHARVPPNVTSMASSLIRQLKEGGQSIEVTTPSGLSFDGDASSIEQPLLISELSLEGPPEPQQEREQEQEQEPEPEPGWISLQSGPEPGLRGSNTNSTDAGWRSEHLLVAGAVLMLLLLCMVAIMCCVVCYGWRHHYSNKKTHETAKQKQTWKPTGHSNSELFKEMENYAGMLKAHQGSDEEANDPDPAWFMAMLLRLATQNADVEEGLPPPELQPELQSESEPEPEPEQEQEPEPEPEPEPADLDFDSDSDSEIESTLQDVKLQRSFHKEGGLGATATAGRAGTPPRTTPASKLGGKGAVDDVEQHGLHHKETSGARASSAASRSGTPPRTRKGPTSSLQAAMTFEQATDTLASKQDVAYHHHAAQKPHATPVTAAASPGLPTAVRANTPPRRGVRVTKSSISASSSTGGEATQMQISSPSLLEHANIDGVIEAAEPQLQPSGRSEPAPPIPSTSVDPAGPTPWVSAPQHVDPAEPQTTTTATKSVAARPSTPPRRDKASSSGGEVATTSMQPPSQPARVATPPRHSPRVQQQIETLCAREDLGYPSEEKVRQALKTCSGSTLGWRRQQTEAIKILRAQRHSNGGKGRWSR